MAIGSPYERFRRPRWALALSCAALVVISGQKASLTVAAESSKKDAMKTTYPSRERLFPSIRAHAELLATQFDQVGPQRQEAHEALVKWLVANYQSGRPTEIIVVCTGNSRRSILGSTWGNISAAYAGLPEVRCYSGGTAPSAFNPRTITTLKAIGVQIEPTGELAPAGADNRIYRVQWGEPYFTKEFSKKYNDPSNPQRQFAALLVCNEADASCPTVAGASKRISLPFADPKEFDGTPAESAKYAERRDEIGRFFLRAFLEARARLDGG